MSTPGNADVLVGNETKENVGENAGRPGISRKEWYSRLSFHGKRYYLLTHADEDVGAPRNFP